MLFDLLSSGLWLLNLNVPATQLIYKPSDAVGVKLLSVTGLSAELGYGLTDTLMASAMYEMNYSLASKNIFLQGFELGGKSYFAGGLSVGRHFDMYESKTVPLLSSYFKTALAQRMFDFNISSKKKVNEFQKPVPLSYSTTGSFFALGAGFGLENAPTENVRVGSEVMAYRSITASTSLSFTQFVGRFSISYQM